MNSKHTPGPWKVETSDVDERFVDPETGVAHLITVGPPTGQAIAMLDPYNANPSHREANARLISAAPDMLHILTAMEGWIDADAHQIYFDGQLCDDERSLKEMVVDALEKVRR